MNRKKNEIVIIGLGYIGLALAVEFSKKYKVVGFDNSDVRIKNLKKFIDTNKEYEANDLKNNKTLNFTSDLKNILNKNIYIVAVPTPIDKKKKPDLSFLLNSCKILSKSISKNSLIIFESTVYPGCTEEVCIPIIEKYSKLKLNKDFYVGYSPERINFGDKKNKLKNVKKIISGSNKTSLDKVYKLYNSIIKAGVYKCESIKIAESAKIIENTQRDINIAFINEIKKIFDLMKINTHKVLEAAKTKWNFVEFEPGLVGGHCISVDPYYLTYKANKINYKSNVILSGRKINDEMGLYYAKKFIEELEKKKSGKKVLVMGLAFKENIPDIRNSKVFDVINFLFKNNYKIDVFDPIVNKSDLKKKLNFNFITQKEFKIKKYNGVFIAVKHDYFINMGLDKIKTLLKKKSVIFDIKNLFNKNI